MGYYQNKPTECEIRHAYTKEDLKNVIDYELKLGNQIISVAHDSAADWFIVVVGIVKGRSPKL